MFSKQLTQDDVQVQKTILIEEVSETDGGLSKKSSVNSLSSAGRTFKRARSDEDGDLAAYSQAQEDSELDK